MKHFRLLALATLALFAFARCRAQVFTAAINTKAALNRPALDGFGNLYIGGFFGDSTTIGGNMIYGGGGNDPLLTKWDASGNLLWYKYGGSADWETISQIITDGAGNVYAMLNFDSALLWEGTVYNTIGGYDYVLVKYDPNGNLLWSKQIGSTGEENAYYGYLNLDGSGNVHLMSITNSASMSVGSSSYTLSGSGYRYVHTKLDAATGNALAVSAIGFTNSVYPLGAGAMYVDANENMYGEIYSASAITLGGMSLTAGGHFFKMNASGGVAWVKDVAYSSDRGNGIAVDASGNVTLTGDWDTNLSLGDTTATQTGVVGNDIFVIHYDAAGTYLWSKVWGGVGADEAPTCKVTAAGDIFIMGVTGGMDVGGYTLTAGGGADPYWMRLASDGTVLEAQTAHSPSSEVVFENQTGSIDASGNIVIACGTMPPTSYGPFTFTDPQTQFFNLLIAGNACQASGTVYRDYNNNGTMDGGDNGLHNAIVSTNTGGYYALSGLSGGYQLFTLPGTYTLSVPNPPIYYTLTTAATQSATFTAMGDVDNGNDFGFYPTPNVRDLVISAFNIVPPKPGQIYSMAVSYTNVGTDTADGTVVVGHDPAMSFFYSNPLGSAVGMDSTQFSFTGLVPGETRTVELYYNIASSASAGTMYNMPLSVNSTGNAEMTPPDNYLDYPVTVVSSYDPNAKEVTPSAVDPSYVEDGLYFTYTLRFQNTGTDTAFQVLLRDTLDANLDVSSFQLLGSTHPVTVSLKNPRVLELLFSNIDLPQSSINEAASHGAVSFRIKADTNMVTPGIIPNKTAIYFDYNVPVITNTATITVGNLSVNNVAAAGNFVLYPNPASTLLFVEAPSGAGSGVYQLSLCDVSGRTLRSATLHKGERSSINVAGLSEGVYFVKMSSGNQKVAVKRVTVVR